jgi:hypothetical protein
MVGCDLHDKTMLLKIAEGREKPETRSVKNTATGRVEMIRLLRQLAWLEEEIETLDRQLLDLAMTDRYRDVFYEFLGPKGAPENRLIQKENRQRQTKATDERSDDDQEGFWLGSRPSRSLLRPQRLGKIISPLAGDDRIAECP